MARTPKVSSPQPANLTNEQARAAIPRLRRRLDELSALKVEELTESTADNVLDDLDRRVDETMVNIYGPDTLDYHRYHIGGLDDSPIIMGGGGPSWHERRGYIRSAVERAIGKLNSAISILTERLEDAGETAATRAITAYRGLDLHPEIARAASKLYSDGHYANAIEAAVKALNGLVRLRSGIDNLDGTTLMEKVFSPKTPVLKFNNLTSQSDLDEQKGFMQLFAGAVSGLRNPRAHGFIQDDPERALEFIAFVSLLAKLLDEAEPA